jgi:hypothetical protein
MRAASKGALSKMNRLEVIRPSLTVTHSAPGALSFVAVPDRYEHLPDSARTNSRELTDRQNNSLQRASGARVENANRGIQKTQLSSQEVE